MTKAYDRQSCGSSLSFIWNLSLQVVDEKGNSHRSEVAVFLEEEVNVSYGIDSELVKKFKARRVMFHIGGDSSSGHYTVAVREQRDGMCQADDSWRYLNSAALPVSLSLQDLSAKLCRYVVGVLLVAQRSPDFAKGSPPVPTRRLPPRCASLSFSNNEQQQL